MDILPRFDCNNAFSFLLQRVSLLCRVTSVRRPARLSAFLLSPCIHRALWSSSPKFNVQFVGQGSRETESGRCEGVSVHGREIQFCSYGKKYCFRKYLQEKWFSLKKRSRWKAMKAKANTDVFDKNATFPINAVHMNMGKRITEISSQGKDWWGHFIPYYYVIAKLTRVWKISKVTFENWLIGTFQFWLPSESTWLL